MQETCVEARKTNMSNGYDYANYNRCVRCITNYPKTERYCPCCGSIMRMKPRRVPGKLALREKHGQKPPVYY